MSICDDCGTIIWSWIIRNGLITHTYKHDNENRKGTIPVFMFIVSHFVYVHIWDQIGKTKMEKHALRIDHMIRWNTGKQKSSLATGDRHCPAVSSSHFLSWSDKLLKTNSVERPKIWIGNDRFVFRARGWCQLQGGRALGRYNKRTVFTAWEGVE